MLKMFFSTMVAVFGAKLDSLTGLRCVQMSCCMVFLYLPCYWHSFSLRKVVQIMQICHVVIDVKKVRHLLQLMTKLVILCQKTFSSD